MPGLTILLAFVINVVVAHAADKPDIVVVLAVDLGYRGSQIRTPSLETLAKGGVRLESCCGQQLCTPDSRSLDSALIRSTFLAVADG